jgi:3-isopropylmalate/(R)-2-methylmalate dehydratase small subunit
MTLERIRGRVAHVFPDDFDVDQIVGVRNIKVQDIGQLVELARSHVGAGFAERVREGDVIVGGANFGYGHPHYPAMRAMRALGIRAVVADSYFPVYWRGEISNGFPQVPCPGIAGIARIGDAVEIDFDECVVSLHERGIRLPFPRFNAFERAILDAGGFRAWLERSIAAERAPGASEEKPNE